MNNSVYYKNESVCIVVSWTRTKVTCFVCPFVWLSLRGADSTVCPHTHAPCDRNPTTAAYASWANTHTYMLISKVIHTDHHRIAWLEYSALFLDTQGLMDRRDSLKDINAMCVIESEKCQMYHAAFWWNSILWNCLYDNHTLNVTVCSGILFQLIAVEPIVLKVCCCWQNSAVAVLVVTSPLSVKRFVMHRERERDFMCVCLLLYCL